MSYRVLQYVEPQLMWTKDTFETEQSAKRFVSKNVDKNYSAVGFETSNGGIVKIATYNKDRKKWANFHSRLW